MDDLIAESAAFQRALDAELAAAPPLLLADARHSAAASGTLLSIEHAGVAREAFILGSPHSATGLVRLQYEALVRGAWWLFAADDGEVALLNEPLDEDADAQGRRWPGATVMQRALQGHAPAGLLAPLHQFHAVAWSGLNPYVHAGVHPMQRRLTGFPEPLARQMLQNSNGLLHLAYRLLTSLTGSDASLMAMSQLWLPHRACLPNGPALG